MPNLRPAAASVFALALAFANTAAADTPPPLCETDGRHYFVIEGEIFAPLKSDYLSSVRLSDVTEDPTKEGCADTPAPALMLLLNGESAGLDWPVKIRQAGPPDRAERRRRQLESLRGDPNCLNVKEESLIACTGDEVNEGLRIAVQYLFPAEEHLLESGSPFFRRCDEERGCIVGDDLSPKIRVEIPVAGNPPSAVRGRVLDWMVTKIEKTSAYAKSLRR